MNAAKKVCIRGCKILASARMTMAVRGSATTAFHVGLQLSGRESDRSDVSDVSDRRNG